MTSSTSEFLKPLPEEHLRAKWQDSELTLTVVCRTFNHEKYVRTTLDSVLAQRTNFRFEVLCFDDASNDNTQAILREYQAAYPHTIRLLLMTENQQGSKGIKAYPTFIQPENKGIFTCAVEGDDYWTDPTKLQQQVDYLKAHPKFIACTHQVFTVDESNNVLNPRHLAQRYCRDFTAHELKRCWTEPLTQSILYRNIIEYPPEFHKSYLGDVFRGSLLGQHGALGFIDTIRPSAYRLHGGGAFSALNSEYKNDVQILTFYWIYRYYARIGDHQTARFFYRRMLEKAQRRLHLSELFKLLCIKLMAFNPKHWL